MKWIDIPGYEGIYQINEEGHVKSLGRYVKVKHRLRYLKERLMAISVKKEGYHFVRLSKEGIDIGYRINRLVAIVFIPNPLDLPEVNHKDGNKANNQVSNLEWCTKKENMAHSWAIGLRKRKKVA
jgi:hypothetical protein